MNMSPVEGYTFAACRLIQNTQISQMEILHVMLKYSEVYTNLNFVDISTMTFELRDGIEIKKTQNVEDGANFGIVIYERLNLPCWR